AWGKVPDLKSKPFKDRHGRRLLETVQTDGVSISIILKTLDAKRNLSRKQNRANDDSTRSKDTRRRQSKLDHSADSSYIHAIPQDESKDTEGKCLLIDSGDRCSLWDE
ncbi:hypothetical protein BX666DRAFT_1958820, partial [Dichotomocladium elegans]